MDSISLDIDDLVERSLLILQATRLDQPGQYRRSALAPKADADAKVNEYGVADAANLLYTLGYFPQDRATRDGFIHTLQSMQNPATGLWSEATHHTFHCTAHCIAALELFDAQPLHPLTGLNEFKSPDGIRRLLEGLDWIKNPWNQSHRGAGVFASLFIAGEADAATRDAYFNWLIENCDPQTGMLRRGCQEGSSPEAAPLHNHMASTFHYLFNIEAARRPVPFAKQIVDSCLQMAASGESLAFARKVSFIFIDWVYCLNRGVRHSGHRFDDARQAMLAAAQANVEHLRSIDPRDVYYNDLHMFFGAWCALAELQTALPGVIRTTRPLRQVLDRRPFI